MLYAAQKAIQQFNVTGNLDRARNTTMFFIIEEVKETILNISEGPVTVLWIYFPLIKYQHKITQHNTLNIKLPNLQLRGIKLWVENGMQVILNLSSNVVKMWLLILEKKLIFHMS